MSDEHGAGAERGDADDSPTMQALSAAVDEIAPAPPVLPVTDPGAPDHAIDGAPSPIAHELTRMRESQDLSPFPITARRPIIGMRLLKRLLRRLLFQVFARQSDFNDAAIHAVSGLLTAERGLRATRRELALAETRLRHAEAEIDALRTRTHGLEQELAAVRAQDARSPSTA